MKINYKYRGLLIFHSRLIVRAEQVYLAITNRCVSNRLPSTTSENR
jgi:hypothetical protein